jgi:hypothetical protein
MITHIVFFKLYDASEVVCREVMEILQGMQGKIPHLRYLQVGRDIIRSERSYDVALVTRFDTLGELDAYQVHPYHAGIVVPFVRKVSASIVTVDYEAD